MRVQDNTAVLDPLTEERAQGRARIVCAPTRLTLPAPPKPAVILLAEDERDIRGFFEFLFAREGFRIQTAEDGAGAVALAPELRPDIALLNNMMPRMSGILACARIHAMPCLDGLPIVVYSACRLEVFRPAALEAGAWACWETPIEWREFLARTKAVLGGRGRDRGARLEVR